MLLNAAVQRPPAVLSIQSHVVYGTCLLHLFQASTQCMQLSIATLFLQLHSFMMHLRNI